MNQSYLEDRTQFVQFGSHRSYNRKISYGVPQGSILRPLLSNIYINDLPNVFSLTQSLLFANDTNIFCSHRTTGHLVSIANNELAKIVTWLNANKLSPNLTKTNLWFFIQGKRKLMLMYLLLWKILWTSKSWKLISAVIIDQHLSYNVMRVTKKQTNK